MVVNYAYGRSMAGRNPPPYRPRGGVNFSSSSRSFHPSRNSTKNVNSEERKKASSSNWDNKAAIDGDIDDIQNLSPLVGTCPFMCPGITYFLTSPLSGLTYYAFLCAQRWNLAYNLVHTQKEKNLSYTMFVSNQ